MKRFLLATLAIITIVGMLVSGCGETAPAEAPEAPTPGEAAVPGVPEAPEAAAPEAAATTTGPQYGGTLRMLVTFTMDANLGWPPDTDWRHILGTNYVIFEPLVRQFRDGSVEGVLATDWELAPDCSYITFDLRRGVKFHDGTEFKADAVKLMVDTHIEDSSTLALNWESVDIIDDYTVRLNLKQFSNALWSDLSNQGAMIASPTAYNTNGLEWMMKNPVGTGPFKFVEFKADQYIKFEKFDDYWQEGKPYLDALELIMVVDPVTLEMTFLAGEGDVCSMQSARAMRNMEDRGYDVYAPYLGVALIVPDCNPGSPFADKRVREALEYALDKEAMVEAIGFGYYGALNQVVYPGHPAYDPSIVGRDYDPDKARELLDEALGVGVGFKTKLIVEPQYKENALLYQRAWEEVGIDAEIEMMDWLAFYEVRTTGWNNALIPAASSLGPNFAAGFRGEYQPYSTTWVSMCVPEGLGDLLDAAIAEPDPDEAIELNRQVLRLIQEEAIIIPTWADSLGYVVNPKVHDGGWLTGRYYCSWRPDNAWIED